MADGTAVSPGAIQAARAFLKSLAQSIKLVSLYRRDHPVAASAIQQALQDLLALFDADARPEATISLVAGRWLFNEAVVADSAQAFELLALAWRNHALVSAAFVRDTRLYEISALCELAATPPNQAYLNDAQDFLKERGVRHIRLNVEEYVRQRRVRQHASATIQSPLARLREGGRERASKAPAELSGAGQGFGAFIKGLVESSIDDPKERAKVYGEAVELIQQALARHVSEATHKLLLEKQGVLNERMRSEHVLARVAEGKVIVDQEGRVLMMDPTAEHISGKALSEAAGKPVLETLATADGLVSLAKDLVIPENRPVSAEVSTVGAEEMLAAFRRSMALVQDEQGRLVGTVSVPPYVTKLREAMQLQDQFIAKVTHDLKGPLASICSTLELIADRLGSKLGENEGDILAIGLRNSQLLKQMIDELLDFSKIQAGAMTIKPVQMPPGVIVDEAVNMLKPWAQSKKIPLKAQRPPQPLPDVLADRGRVLEVLSNLISNALKFTPEGGSIRVGAALAAERPGCVVFFVSDNGCGIAPADQQRLFAKFSQIARDGQRPEGVGLGLAIVKELVTMHGGEVWVDSKPGEGSTFSFSLPVAVSG